MDCLGYVHGFIHKWPEASLEGHSARPQLHRWIDLFHRQVFSPEAPTSLFYLIMGTVSAFSPMSDLWSFEASTLATPLRIHFSPLELY